MAHRKRQTKQTRSQRVGGRPMKSFGRTSRRMDPQSIKGHGGNQLECGYSFNYLDGSHFNDQCHEKKKKGWFWWVW